MKNRKTVSRAKKLAALAVIGSIAGTFEDVKYCTNLALSSEKNTAEKRDLAIAKNLVKNFYEKLEPLEVIANDTTILTFCKKMCNMLVENSHGRDKARSYKAIVDAVDSEFASEKYSRKQDDSEKLFKVF